MLELGFCCRVCLVYITIAHSKCGVLACGEFMVIEAGAAHAMLFAQGCQLALLSTVPCVMCIKQCDGTLG